MFNNFFRQTGNTARDAAKKAAQQIAHEPAEILKSAKEQVVQSEQPQRSEGPSMMQEVMTQNGQLKQVSEMEEKSIHARTKSRLEEIEAELRQYRMQREKASEEWIKDQNKAMGITPEGQQQKPAPPEAALPQGKKHGAAKPGPKKSATPGGSNTMENSRQKKG